MGNLKKNSLGKNRSCSIDIDTFGRVRAVRSANGSHILHIVKDSIEILQTPREKFSGIARVKLELFISEDQINLLNSNPL